MTPDLRCSNCQSVIDPANIDSQREIATCGRCGHLTDLRRAQRASPQGQASGAPRARPPVELPIGMTVTQGAELVIRRRWLRAKHWRLLVLFAAAGAGVAYLWATVGMSWWLVVGTLFVVNWNFMLLGTFLNSTVVTADATGVTVRHGPVPSLFGLNRSAKKEHIEQLYAARFGNLYAVMVKLKGGHEVRLVAPLITAAQAMFIEQQVERALGIVDAAVEGELDDAGFAAVVQGKPVPGESSGKAMVFLVPLFLAGGLGLFFLMASTDVSGKLQASGALGTWAFEPDDCSSGQHEGFGGVVLKSEAQPGRLIRVVKDPIRGSLLVVVSPGKPNHVLSGEGCSSFDVSVTRGDTNINDIWAMDGGINIQCSELSGVVRFVGCH